MARGVKQKDKKKSFFDFFKRKQENNGAESQEEKASYLPKRFYFIWFCVGSAVLHWFRKPLWCKSFIPLA